MFGYGCPLEIFRPNPGGLGVKTVVVRLQILSYENRPLNRDMKDQ